MTWRRLLPTLGLALAVCGLLAAIATGSAAAPSYAPERLSATGTPEEIGAAIGGKYAAMIRGFHPLFLSLGQNLTGSSKAELYKKSIAIAAHLAPADVEEMKATAAAAGLAYEDVLYLNLFFSLTNGPRACRQIAVWGGHTTQGQLLHARNLDWVDYPGEPLKKHNLILNVKPKDGREYLTLTWPSISGVLTGTNRDGITVGFNTLTGGGPERLAEPTFFTLKRVLRSCGTLAEAVDLIREARPMGNGTLLISSARERRAVVVEVFDGQVGVRGAKNDMIGNANHATHEAGLSMPRYFGAADAPTCEVARQMGVRFDARNLRGVMASPGVMAQGNLLSVIFDPSANRMFLSCGRAPAATGKFEEITLFPE